MVVSWRYRMLFNADGGVSTLMNVDWIKLMCFRVNEFAVGVHGSRFSGNKQQKVYYTFKLHPFSTFVETSRLNWIIDERSSSSVHRETISGPNNFIITLLTYSGFRLGRT